MWHFGRVLSFGALLAALAVLGSVEALAQKKKDKDAKDYPAATDADYKSIQKQKELPGKLIAINTSTVTIRVDYPHQEPNPKYKPPKDNNQINQILKTYNDLQIQYQKAAYGNPKHVMQAQQRIANDMAKLQTQYAQLTAQLAKTNNDPNNQPFITITNTKDFDLEIMEKCIYRKLNLPFEYDDSGNAKTYTKEEKDELRGDDKSKPGYTAKFEELAAGQDIKLYLTPPKKKEKDADGEKDKDAPKEPVEVQRPTVNMIVITKDNPTANATADDSKGKKKKKDNN
jgi:uncharacterized protein YqiB (DUF1249 family)